MIRASTPEHTFELPFERDYLAKMVITYSQGEKPNHKIILEKTEADVVYDESDPKVFSITLTQEETLLFDPENSSAIIQIHALTQNGKSIQSEEIWVNIRDARHTEVLE